MRRAVLGLCATLLVIAFPGIPGWAADFGLGRLPIHVELPASAPVGPSTVLVVEGRVEADQPIIVVLRLDDDWSDSAYASRVNEERLTPPGPFRWVIPVKGLKTSGGRLLRSNTLRRVHLFNASSSGSVSVGKFRFEDALSLPPGTLALSLGAPDAPLFPGFERVEPGDARIVDGHAVPVRRPGLDPLISSGMRGIERVRLAWPPGRATVTLWLEDVGEWETLPYFLRRRVRINGIDVVDQTFTPQQWIESRYLQGADNVYEPGADGWQTYGRRRGGQVTAQVDVGSDGITIELAGDTPAATFLSAVLVEPAGAASALAMVTAQRREWFNNAWPVAPERRTAPPAELPPQFDVTLAPGTGHRLQFELSDPTFPPPEVVFELPDAAKGSFELRHWIAEPRLDRTSTGTNLLQPSYRLLRSRRFFGHAASRMPQRHILWISAASDVAPGNYSGVLKIKGPHGAEIPLNIVVLPVALPSAPKPAGFYLEPPAHLGWFSETAVLGEMQLVCDMRFLAKLGIFGNAPPLPPPTADRQSAIAAQSRLALQNATAVPWLAYSAAKQVRDTMGLEAAARQIGKAQSSLTAAGLPLPVWSIADEPSNPDQPADKLSRFASALRDSAPGIKLAGHLNTPNDARLLDLFDVALVNDGYGLDVQAIRSIRRKGATPWLYNTGKMRLTAGLWLWRTEAEHYLQWHARMPTADPFDPTDGREGDVQMFPPTADVCTDVPDIDEGVLEMAEGLVDQRWLTWLETAPGGRQLLRAIRSRLPTDWRSAMRLSDREIEAIRTEIEALARGLK